MKRAFIIMAAAAALFATSCKNDEVKTEMHEYVDLGLSVKWTTCNVGVANPWDYGDYFAWGETSPKTNYVWATYAYGTSSSNLTKYSNTDNKTVLDMADDAARANWGGSWRMPTQSELNELVNSCTWTWTTQNGVSGYSVSRNGYTGSIFLPAASFFDGTFRYASGGFYCSATRGSGNAGTVRCLNFGNGYRCEYSGSRCFGFTVRPVCD